MDTHVFVTGLCKGEYHGRGNFSSPAVLHPPSPDENYLPTLGAVELIGFSWSAWYETFLHTWLILSLLCVAGDADPIHVLSNNLNSVLKCVPIKKKRQKTKYWLLLPTKLQETKASRMNTENVLA